MNVSVVVLVAWLPRCTDCCSLTSNTMVTPPKGVKVPTSTRIESKRNSELNGLYTSIGYIRSMYVSIKGPGVYFRGI